MAFVLKWLSKLYLKHSKNSIFREMHQKKAKTGNQKTIHFGNIWQQVSKNTILLQPLTLKTSSFQNNDKKKRR